MLTLNINGVSGLFPKNDTKTDGVHCVVPHNKSKTF
jgi:hypothetical protein